MQRVGTGVAGVEGSCGMGVRAWRFWCSGCRSTVVGEGGVEGLRMD